MMILLLFSLFTFNLVLADLLNGICTEEKQFSKDRQDVELTNAFCCAGFEKHIDGKCEVCKDGYTSEAGKMCTSCLGAFYGKGCIKACDCEPENCHHVTGCINITETSSLKTGLSGKVIVTNEPQWTDSKSQTSQSPGDDVTDMSDSVITKRLDKSSKVTGYVTGYTTASELIITTTKLGNGNFKEIRNIILPVSIGLVCLCGAFGLCMIYKGRKLSKGQTSFIPSRDDLEHGSQSQSTSDYGYSRERHIYDEIDELNMLHNSDDVPDRKHKQGNITQGVSANDIHGDDGYLHPVSSDSISQSVSVTASQDSEPKENNPNVDANSCTVTTAENEDGYLRPVGSTLIDASVCMKNASTVTLDQIIELKSNSSDDSIVSMHNLDEYLHPYCSLLSDSINGPNDNKQSLVRRSRKSRKYQSLVRISLQPECTDRAVVSTGNIHSVDSAETCRIGEVFDDQFDDTST